MISVVIPIYNEEEIVERLTREVGDVMDQTGEAWEAIYVNDGSRDDSLALLLRQQARDAHIIVVDLSRNWGHQPAITAGLAQVSGEAVILMDGDLQDPPSTIFDMLDAWRAGAQVVIAERRSRGENVLRRFLFSCFYKALARLSDFPIPLNAGIFSLLDRQVVDAVNSLSESNRYLPGLRAWVGFPVSMVYYDRAPRAAGEPKQTFSRLLRYGLDAIFSFSYKPLRFGLLAGVAIASVSVFLACLFLVLRILGIGLFGADVVYGYTSIIVSVLFLGGVQLISVGILGEYVGRVYDEVKRRPLYIVQKVYERREPGYRVSVTARRAGDAAESETRPQTAPSRSEP
jgi:glycosyltransferase involved in cell wall biosynthesis